MTSPKEKCPNCSGDIAIRNPTGKCDHLYYPENVPSTPKTDEGKECENCAATHRFIKSHPRAKCTCPCHEHKAVEGWEEEFEEKFGCSTRHYCGGKMMSDHATVAAVKEFIFSLILKAKEEERKEIAKLWLSEPL